MKQHNEPAQPCPPAGGQALDTHHYEAGCRNPHRWRYASTIAPRQIFPIYFQRLADAKRYDAQTAAALGCLPGMTTMRIEEWDGQAWRPLADTP